MIPDVLGLSNYTVNETETVVFECSATGIPAPIITWFRNGMELNSGRFMPQMPTTMSYNRTSDGETVVRVIRTLVLMNTEDSDSGTYICNATNSVGSDDGQFECIVQSEFICIMHQRLCRYSAFLVLVAPTITDLSPWEQTVSQSTEAMFTCSATGRPRPTIQWYREISGSRTLLPDGQSNEIMSGTREISSTLTIDPTSPSDVAEYVCMYGFQCR